MNLSVKEKQTFFIELIHFYKNMCHFKMKKYLVYFLFSISCILPKKTVAQVPAVPADTSSSLVLLEQAWNHFYDNKMDMAYLLADSSYIALTDIYGKNHEAVAEALEVKVKSLNTMGLFNEALPYAKEAVAIRKQVLKPTDLKLGYSYNDLGYTYDGLGDFEIAIKQKLSAKTIFEYIYKQPHDDLLKIYLNIGASYFDLRQINTAKDYLEKGIAMTRKLYGNDNNIYIQHYYNNLGAVYEELGLFDKGKELKKKALDLKVDMYGENHSEVASAYLNYAKSLHFQGRHKEAIAHLKKAVEIYKTTLGDSHPILANAYLSLCAANNEYKEHDKAIVYGEMAIHQLSLSNIKTHPLIAQAYNNIAAAYENLGQHEKSLEVYEKSLDMFYQIYQGGHLSIAETSANMGVPLQGLGEFDKAITYYRKAIPIIDANLGKMHFYAVFSYNGLGIAYLKKADYKKAFEALDTALLIKKKTFGKDHTEVSISLINLANAYVEIKNYKKAIGLYDESINIIEKLKNNIAEEIYYNLKTKIEQGKGKAFWELYKDNGKEEYLKLSRAFFEQSLESIKKQILSVSSKGFDKVLSSEIKRTAEMAVSVNMVSQQDVNKCFAYSELSKGFQLLEGMKKADVAHFSGISDSLLQKEYNFQNRIDFLEKVISGNAGIVAPDSLIPFYKKELLELNNQYEKLVKIYKQKNRPYFDAKFRIDFTTVSQVQTYLSDTSEMLLEYFTGDSSIFIFTIKKGDYQVHEIKKDFPLEDWVKQLQNGLSGYYGKSKNERTDDLYKATLKDYLEAAPKLYEKLIAPIKDLLTDEVILIPDGVLGYVPFGALLTGKPKSVSNFASYPFLLNGHQFSYCYSATLLREMKEKRHKNPPTKSLVAFAPFYEGSYVKLDDEFGAGLDTIIASLGQPSFSSSLPRKELTELPDSGEEVFAASKIWNGDYFINSDATEGQFNQVAGGYRIVHLSTHGIADPRVGDYSYLAFAEQRDSIENEYLYVRDLYNLQLNADLVVLSACETAVGELQRGEGIISLARAFAYAGAKSILTTLWVVDDAASKDLTKEFYLQLKQGKKKDEALRLAKMKLMKVNKNSRKHPFFWAAMIPVGDMSAVD
ncbi:MAG TPA: CHAT domain-containing protein [Bacteroidetes bacterium]|nr:CHAT domain-containing protein [Bacteroidota bacterium]